MLKVNKCIQSNFPFFGISLTPAKYPIQAYFKQYDDNYNCGNKIIMGYATNHLD